MADWRVLISELQQKHGVSGRQLASNTGVCRGTLLRFLAGKMCLRTDELEIVLAQFGYDLDAIMVDPEIALPKPKPPPEPKPRSKPGGLIKIPVRRGPF